jgi:beta-glucanase (GH16 family)
MLSLREKLLKKPRKNILISAVAAVAVLVVGYILISTRAAGPFAVVDTGKASVVSPATLVSDASSPDGKAIQFNAATPPPPPTTPPPTTPPSGNTCPAGQIGTPPNCISAPPFAAPAGKTWGLSFSEEFNGTDFDHNKLNNCFDWNYGDCSSSFNQGREHYLPSQVRVSGGTAKLVAEPLSPAKNSAGCYQGKCTYKSGMLTTSRPRADDGSPYLYKFTYGYVESRLKFPATQGFFTAFWMLPADPSFNYRSEIDILELLGNDPKTMFMTYHYANRTKAHHVNNGTGNNGACPAKDYSKDFVTVGLDWQPNRIAWYIDGVKCSEFTNASQIENGPMQIIIDLMVDHQWQRDWGVTLQDQTLTRQLELDYLRVYQLK